MRGSASMEEDAARFRSRFSRRSSPISRALRTAVRRRSMESGFSMKSKAPSLRARTAMSIVPWPETTRTSISGLRFFISARASRPPIRGSQTSSTARSGRWASIASRPTTASSATMTSWPSSSRMSRTVDLMPGSSSITRMVAIARLPPSFTKAYRKPAIDPAGGRGRTWSPPPPRTRSGSRRRARRRCARRSIGRGPCPRSWS